MPKITVELDLNEPQLATLTEMKEKYRHGWHTADLVVRKDGKESRFEADWVRDVLLALPTV